MDVANPSNSGGRGHLVHPQTLNLTTGRAKWSSDRPRSITRPGQRDSGSPGGSSGRRAAAGQVGRAAERRVSLPPQERAAGPPGSREPTEVPREAGLYSGVSPCPPAEDPVSLWPQDRAVQNQGYRSTPVCKAHSLCVHLRPGGAPLKGYIPGHGSPWVDSGALCAQSAISGLTSC